VSQPYVLEHKHLIVRAELAEPPYQPHHIKDWMKRLVDKIGMNVLMGPYAIYSDMEGNQGLTAITIIETSHCAIHVWDEVTPALAQIDVYSCQAFDINDVFDFIKEFNPTKIEYKYIDRETGLQEISCNTLASIDK
jgi:S-adenosylmethionine/arginine decarboxylase-like enzyme